MLLAGCPVWEPVFMADKMKDEDPGWPGAWVTLCLPRDKTFFLLFLSSFPDIIFFNKGNLSPRWDF